MPQFTKFKTLLARLETTYGVDPVPVAATHGMLVSNLTIRPMNGSDVSRNVERSFNGPQQMFPVGLAVQLDFEVELIGHATRGTAPAWSPIARACGLAEVVTAGTSVVYNPISTGHESVTCYFAMDGARHIVTGCRGTARLRLNAQSLAVLAVTLTGLYADPAAAARVTPTLTAFQAPIPVTRANTPTFTVNGVSLPMRSYELDFANQVEQRLLVGLEEILIVDSDERLRVQVEAVPLGTLNPFALARAQTSFAVNLVHGSGSGRIVTINLPTCRMMRPESYNETQKIAEWPLTIVPLPNAGNDQFTLSLT